MKVLFPVQHGFAVYSKREMLIVGSEEEWFLWIGIIDLPITAGVRSKIQEVIHTKLRV